ncbi:UNVERIFIED_CONTAM: hypothetical protein HDU68_008660 [Siphonaria sp. JEL0065]|nr:hypothetical protein HDU68_008660 [Siphonaria sp. JEL0065]
MLELRTLTATNVDTFNDVHLDHNQYHAIAYPPMTTWYSFYEDRYSRVIWETTLDKPIGLIEISLDTDGPGEHCLEVFLIDKRFQGKGYGRSCMDLVFQTIKQDLPGLRKGIKLSYELPLLDSASPEEFYLKLGFRHLGTFDEDGFIEMYYAFDEKDHKSEAGTVALVGRSSEPFTLIPELEHFKFLEFEKGMQPFPREIQSADLVLQEYTRTGIFDFYHYKVLGPMCLSNARWFNWAVRQPPDSIVFKLMYSGPDVSRFSTNPDLKPAAVGYMILQKQTRDTGHPLHVLKHVFVNPNVRGRALTNKACDLVGFEITVPASDCKRTRASMGLDHLHEEDGKAVEDISLLLMKLGFKVNTDGDFVRTMIQNDKE